MIELTEQQRMALESGEPIRVRVGGRAVVLLRADVLRRIQATLEIERAVIEAGDTRAPMSPPPPLLAIESAAETLTNVAMLPDERYDEIQELIADDRIRSAWGAAVNAAQSSWAKNDPFGRR